MIRSRNWRPSRPPTLACASSASAATSARPPPLPPASLTPAAGSSSPPTATCRTTRATSQAWSQLADGDGYDIVCGWRKDRKDTFVTRRIPSMVANWLISKATGVPLHDYGCSLKVFRAEVVKPLRLYGEMHRFLPAIASEQGVRIAEVVVNHRARRAGTHEVRAVAHHPRGPRSGDGQVPAQLLDPAAADLRPARPGLGRPGRAGHGLPGLACGWSIIRRSPIGRCCCSACCWFHRRATADLRSARRTAWRAPTTSRRTSRPT